MMQLIWNFNSFIFYQKSKRSHKNQMPSGDRGDGGSPTNSVGSHGDVPEAGVAVDEEGYDALRQLSKRFVLGCRGPLFVIGNRSMAAGVDGRKRKISGKMASKPEGQACGERQYLWARSAGRSTSQAQFTMTDPAGSYPSTRWLHSTRLYAFVRLP